MLYISSTDQYTLSLIVVRGILDVYANYCRTVITNTYVDYWMHTNKSLKNLCTDYHGWKQCLYVNINPFFILQHINMLNPNQIFILDENEILVIRNTALYELPHGSFHK